MLDIACRVLWGQSKVSLSTMVTEVDSLSYHAKTVGNNQNTESVLRRLIWVCTVCQCPSPGFTDKPLYMEL